MATASPLSNMFKPPKPTPFTGEKRDSETVANFLYQVKIYCRASRVTTDDSKLDVVTLLLSSRASSWFQLNESAFTGDYSIFEDKFRANFTPPNEQATLMRRFQAVSQAKGVFVDEFAQEFRTVVDRIGVLPAAFAHDCFVNALELETQIEIKGHITSMESWDELVLKAVVAEEVAQDKAKLEARKARDVAGTTHYSQSPASSSQNWRHSAPTQQPTTPALTPIPAYPAAPPGLYRGSPPAQISYDSRPLTNEEKARLYSV
jgi:Ty3 transposon capsid-like protein